METCTEYKNFLFRHHVQLFLASRFAKANHNFSNLQGRSAAPEAAPLCEGDRDSEKRLRGSLTPANRWLAITKTELLVLKIRE